MNNQTEPQSKLASVDLDQWRRDIDAFAAATSSALDAIVGELSTACSSDGVPAVSPTETARPIAELTPIAKHSHNESAAKRTAVSPSSANKSGLSPSSGGSRLALLKEKLASRLKNG